MWLPPKRRVYLASLIGTVKEVNSESDGLTMYAVIEPFANIRDLTNVFVITEFSE